MMAQYVVKGIAWDKSGRKQACTRLSCERSRHHAECVQYCAQRAAGMNTEIHRGATPEGAIPGGRVEGAEPADSGRDCKY